MAKLMSILTALAVPGVPGAKRLDLVGSGVFGEVTLLPVPLLPSFTDALAFFGGALGP